MTPASSSGNQPPSISLIALAATKIESTSRNNPFTATTASRVVAPLQRDQGRQHGRDRHQHRDGDAVGAAERVGGAEADHAAIVPIASAQFTIGM